MQEAPRAGRWSIDSPAGRGSPARNCSGTGRATQAARGDDLYRQTAALCERESLHAQFFRQKSFVAQEVGLSMDSFRRRSEGFQWWISSVRLSLARDLSLTMQGLKVDSSGWEIMHEHSFLTPA